MSQNALHTTKGPVKAPPANHTTTTTRGSGISNSSKHTNQNLDENHNNRVVAHDVKSVPAVRIFFFNFLNFFLSINFKLILSPQNFLKFSQHRSKCESLR